MAAWMFPWMAGSMFVPPLVGVKAQDINGVAITVGATVKMIGTVTSIDVINGHFANIVVTPSNPTPDSKTTVPKTPVGFHPLQLVVGS